MPEYIPSPHIMKQGDYTMRRVGNYFDQIYGSSYHPTMITFNEFCGLPESLFLYDDTFMQIPGYIQNAQDIEPIEDYARRFVVNYIMDEFKHNFLAMQDIERWATLFRNRCDSVCASFWAQVNMVNLMLAKDLEMDETHNSGMNIGNSNIMGGQTVNTDSTGHTESSGETTTKQDTTNTTTQDGSQREGTVTTVSAEDQLNADMEYDWTHAADNFREVKSRPAETAQHVEGTGTSNSISDSTNHSVSSTTANNSENNSTAKNIGDSTYTNKQFMQERQWAVDTARNLLPLEWLRTQLRPCFYQIY